MKHILLTGATGFLGSHLLEELLIQGYKVSILKRSTSDTSRIQHLMEEISCIDVDLVKIEEGYKVEKIDATIHTACSYGRDGESEHEVVKTNLLYAMRVYDFSRLNKCKLFINIGTTLNNQTIYSLSKIWFIDYLKIQKEIKTVNVVFDHMYGDKAGGNKFINWVIEEMKNKKKVNLTSCNQYRNFIHIKTIIKGIKAIIEKEDNGEVFSNKYIISKDIRPLKCFIEEIRECVEENLNERVIIKYSEKNGDFCLKRNFKNIGKIKKQNDGVVFKNEIKRIIKSTL